MATTSIRQKCFSEDLWDKFDCVVKRVGNGKQFTNMLSKFLLKQQQIESMYGKSLNKLCKDKTFCSDMEIGDQLEYIANLHEEFSHNLETLIVEGIDAYIQESRKQRKTLIATGERLTKDLRTAEGNELKAKQNYEKLKRKQEEANEDLSRQPPGAKEQKARKNLETATKTADKADAEYKDNVKILQQNQAKFYHDEMPKILDDLQRFEVDRIDRTKDWLSEVIRNEEIIPPLVTAANEIIRKSIDSIDREKDLQSFILDKTSGAQKPPETQYEPYQASNPLATFSMLMSPSASGSPMHISANDIANLQRRSLHSSTSSSNSTESNRSSLQGASTSPESGDTVRALYDYVATEENELSFKANNMIKVMQRDVSGWWQGTIVGGDGKVGMFPSNFVECPDAIKKKDVAGGKCKVLYDYHSDCDGELEIKEGETLTIEYEDEGWFYGSNETGTAGRFPSNYVQLVRV
ncbi:hypothetical protein SAMD00019534_077930 [Acytostelium subglobosum LB1]|uniref:hypothetical protein n=1 Tax=Acytostelium subglobosum LB1 TaxID=1410327 RepID=UPI000644F54F|nr:hypothetical protein SAMD00019534_077930 [Acytostelium subglobosum LB1]GAM24618.1 hypothetical protein SAMD00019534_077930 [Acytostelium subglobosum LB1]|eukprot:XP_012752287.1 hypothetical protein SAMD00019534_077930 [Acytostelium subglobosum LB1]